MTTLTISRASAGVTVAVLAVALLLGSAVAAIGRLDGPDTRFAFVARGDNPVDALAAAPIAGRLDAPVLLTPPGELADQAREGLADQTPDVVIIAGGVTAISTSVETAIGNAVPDAQVRRVSGESRYDTAAALAALVREYDPAFAYHPVQGDGDTNAYGISCADGKVLSGITADGDPVCTTDRDTDTNAYGVSCSAGQLLTGITADGQPACTDDQVDGGDAATLDGRRVTDFAPAWSETVQSSAPIGYSLPANSEDRAIGSVQLDLPATCPRGTVDEHKVLVTAFGVVTTYNPPVTGHLDLWMRLAKDHVPDDTTGMWLQVDEVGEDHPWSHTAIMSHVGSGTARFGAATRVVPDDGATTNDRAFLSMRYQATVIGHRCTPLG